jgi:hypothetical protein
MRSLRRFEHRWDPYVISYRELVLLLNAADRADQLDALVSLIDRGLVSVVIDGDAITAIRTTATGNAKLNGMTLPTAQS